MTKKNTNKKASELSEDEIADLKLQETVKAIPIKKIRTKAELKDFFSDTEKKNGSKN